ncbi:RimK family alpha-L-glutamate ligase [Fictibacillus aquaticus]|uniref:ATP-grasp domain-containing protein n=1 Tax=Fictibacillus aquaticus TaxID=2021314 RepID=A0A235FAX0_9BACL|nr:hypothetical protein [Fictibacillus aquaticus]OYD58077.1 hypothetical protein CGZ90_09330 [Fictibacillus aquaticus]
MAELKTNASGWIIYTKQDAQTNKEYIEWFLKEASLLKLSLRLLERERFIIGVKNGRNCLLYDGKELNLPDFAVVRCIDSLFSHHLEIMDIKVFNPSLVSEIANDKARTHQFLAQHHIPMTETYFIDKVHCKQELIPLDFPFVLKESGGRGGKNVHLVHTIEELQELVTSSESRSWVAQRLAGTPGKDVRVFIVGQKIAGAVLRSSESDFRANFSLGGTAELYYLNDEEKTLVENIASLLPVGMAGIDFLFDENGKFLFNEIEDVAGSRTLSACSDINIVRLYLEHITDTLKNPADH